MSMYLIHVIYQITTLLGRKHVITFEIMDTVRVFVNFLRFIFYPFLITVTRFLGRHLGDDRFRDAFVFDIRNALFAD